MKQVLLWSGAGLLIAGGLVLVLTFVSPSSGTDTVDGPPVLGTPVSEQDHVKGNTEAGLVLIEYGDFQCPACASYFPIIKQIEQEFGTQIGIAYRQFPLRNIHRNAESAALAAEAAGLQGKFWEMHDMLFASQREWAPNSSPKDMFVEYARSLGLDSDQFAADMDSQEVKEKVQSDLQTGAADGVNSTPSFYLGDEKMVNPRTYEEFRDVILAALAANAEAESIVPQSSEMPAESEVIDEAFETDDSAQTDETDS